MFVRSLTFAARAAAIAVIALFCVAPAFACPVALVPDREIRFAIGNAAWNIEHGWSVWISVAGGAPRKVLVDTGSVGLAIAVSAIPPGVPRGEAAAIRYSSSGKILSGHIYRVPIAFLDFRNVRTRAIPVLGVDTVSCDTVEHPACVEARGEANDVRMLGVGFGRHGSAADLADVTGGAEDSVNPFLQLEAMRDGTLRRTYTIYRDAIVLGPARDSNSPEWRTVELTRHAGSDWNPPPGCFTEAALASHCDGSTALVDTGVDRTIFATPEHPSGDVKPGVRFVVAIGRGPGLSFAFTSARTCSRALSCARWSHRTAFPTFVNTSRRLIETADYRFDDVCGTVAFRSDRNR